METYHVKMVGNEELGIHPPAASRNLFLTSFHPYQRSLTMPRYWTLRHLHAAVPRRERFIYTAWEQIPTPALKSAALCTAAEAAPTASIPASRRSGWDLEIIFPAQTHSRLQEEFANMICLSACFHFRGAREEDTKKKKPFKAFLFFGVATDTRGLPKTVSTYTAISDIYYVM